MNTGMRLPVAGLTAWAPMNTPVFSRFSCRSSSDLREVASRYSATASRGVAVPPVQRSSVPAGHWSPAIRSTSGCSGASTM
jgi:hypothetical protein